MKQPIIASLCRSAVRPGMTLMAIAMAACTLDNQDPPALTGPSEFAVSVTMTASPDQLPRDGSSMSVVTVTVRDAHGKLMNGQRVSLTLPTSAPEGTALSQPEVTTGVNGQASFAVVAPVSGSMGDIVVAATPIGTNAANAVARTISIAATPSNGTVPTPAFTFTPSTPEVGQVVTFDASATKDEEVACVTCVYSWSFAGDGTATGRVVTHTFTAGGSYVVTLRVTDVSGSSASVQQTVTVSVLNIPTGVGLTSSPATPIAGQPATFTASATPATNHRIVRYEFSWGDGSSDALAAPVIQHTYSQTGSYLITLTVTDDQGQRTTFNRVITVTSGLTASFTTTKSVNDVTFDASASSSAVASTIVDYSWDFESDGTYDVSGASSVVTHTYVPGTYRATLKVTDDRGTWQTVSATVTVP